MIIIHVFLALLWGFAVLGVFLGGLLWTYGYALDSDKAGVSLLRGLWGVVWRVLCTLSLMTVVIGVPLQLTFN